MLKYFLPTKIQQALYHKKQPMQEKNIFNFCTTLAKCRGEPTCSPFGQTHGSAPTKNCTAKVLQISGRWRKKKAPIFEASFIYENSSHFLGFSESFLHWYQRSQCEYYKGCRFWYSIVNVAYLYRTARSYRCY